MNVLRLLEKELSFIYDEYLIGKNIYEDDSLHKLILEKTDKKIITKFIYSDNFNKNSLERTFSIEIKDEIQNFLEKNNGFSNNEIKKIIEQFFLMETSMPEILVKFKSKNNLTLFNYVKNYFTNFSKNNNNLNKQKNISSLRTHNSIINLIEEKDLSNKNISDTTFKPLYSSEFIDFQYVNFEDSKLNNISIISGNFNNTNFKNTSLDNFSIKKQKKELFVDCYFSQSIFRNSHLENIDFRKNILEKSSFINVSFEQCIFSNLILENFNFENSKFENCKFENTIFNNCNLNKTNFINTSFKESTIKNSSLKTFSILHSNLERLLIEECVLEDISFNKINFSYGSIRNSNIVKIKKFSGNFSFLEAFNIDFSQAIMSKSDFSNSDFRNCLFISTKFTNSNFNNALMSFSNFSNSNLEGVNMNNSTLNECKFDSADFTNVKMTKEFFNKIKSSLNQEQLNKIKTIK